MPDARRHICQYPHRMPLTAALGRRRQTSNVGHRNKLASMIARASSFLPTRAASGWHAAVYECKLARLGRVTSRAEAEAELFESMPRVLDAVEKPKLDSSCRCPSRRRPPNP